MKKILLLITITLFAFTTHQREKTLKVEMTLQQWDSQFVKMQNVRDYIDKSNLPHNDVKRIISDIDGFLTTLSAQLTPQIDTTKNKK